jgi:hypothetical protein
VFHQCGLAGAILADDGQEVAGLDGEIHARQGRGSVIVVVPEILYLYGRLGRFKGVPLWCTMMPVGGVARAP